MKKVLSVILALVMIIGIVGAVPASAVTLAVTFSATVNANNVGTINVMKTGLVAGTEYEYAFYDANSQIISHPVAQNRQWFGLKFDAVSTNWGYVQVDSTNAWYKMNQWGSGNGFFILPLTYVFAGATKLEIREKAAPENTSGIIDIDMSKVSTNPPGTAAFGLKSYASTIPGAIKLQTNASRVNPGCVFYYVAGPTNAAISYEYLKSNGGKYMAKGDANLSINTDVYLTDPSAEYFNILNSTNTGITVYSCSTATFNSLTPLKPDYISITAGTLPGTFVINGLLPYTYEYLMTGSADVPADWSGSTSIMCGQGITPNIIKTNSFLHIRTKAGTRITANSPVQTVELSAISVVSDLTVTNDAASPQILSAAGGQYSFNVTVAGDVNSSKPVTLQFEKSEQADWLQTSVDPVELTGAGTLTGVFSVSANESEEPRDVTVTVKMASAPDSYRFSKESFDILVRQGGIAVGDPPNFPDATAAEGTMAGTTSITIDSPSNSGLYVYGWSPDSNEENVISWSGFVTAENFVNIAVPRGGIRYLFIKAVDKALRESPANGINLMGCVKAPARPTGAMTLNNNVTVTKFTDPNTIQCWIAEAGTFDIGSTDSYTNYTTGGKVLWTAFNKVFDGTNVTQWQYYLAWNARFLAMRYSADGAIPESLPVYCDRDLNSSSRYVQDERVINLGTALNKYEFVRDDDGNLTFTEGTVFLPYMRYVAFVDGDLSGDTTAASASKYAYVSNNEYERRGQLFGAYVRTKMTSANTFYTDKDGKPFSDADCSSPVSMEISGSPSQFVYIAPCNITVSAYYLPITAADGGTCPFGNTSGAFGGSGSDGALVRNVVQRCLISSLPEEPIIDDNKVTVTVDMQKTALNFELTGNAPELRPMTVTGEMTTPITATIKTSSWITASINEGNIINAAGDYNLTVSVADSAKARRGTVSIVFTGDKLVYNIPAPISFTVYQGTFSPDEIKAFPGAEGYGALAKGGRGGDVYHVTNLNNDGDGSLRYGIDSATGPRTIVFDVGGTINLMTNLPILNHPNMTIAGQTAPGNGIMLRGGQLSPRSSDLVIRFLRSRPGLDNNTDAINVMGGFNIIVDHCSASWASDELLSASGFPPTHEKYVAMGEITVQWCYIYEPLLSTHQLGSLVKTGFGSGITFHHNLYANIEGRMPAPGNYGTIEVDPEGWYFDFRNNVIANPTGATCGYTSISPDAMLTYNLMNNYYKKGSNSPLSMDIWDARTITAVGHVSGNIIRDKTGDNAGIDREINWTKEIKGGGVPYLKPNPYPVPDFAKVYTQSAVDAYNDVIKYAGCSLVRDSADERITNEVQSAGGRILAGSLSASDWPQMYGGPAPEDTDRDGMPDSFETSNNLDPNLADDRTGYTLDPMYTNLECYLNGLVAHIITYPPEIEEEQPVDLTAEKAAAKAELSAYVTDINVYRPAQQTEVADAISAGESAIDAATTLSEIATALADAKAVIDAIKTDAELTAEEQALAQAKIDAKAELNAYVPDLGIYPPAQQTGILNAISAGEALIDSAANLEAVATALANAKSAIDTIIAGYSVYGYVSYPNVTVTIDGKSSTVDENGYFSVDGLQPGVYNLTVERMGALKRTISVTIVDSDVEVSLEGNKITLMFGDIDSDGGINVSDISAVKLHFGEFSGGPAFEPLTDLDFNGSINISDLSLVKGIFGLTTSDYPEWIK